MRSGDCAVEPVGGRPFVDRVEQAGHLEVGQRALIAQRARKQRLAVPDTGQAADQPDADAGQGVEVEGRALGRADELKRGHVACSHDVVDFVIALVEHAGGIHPPLDVTAAIDARHAHVLAHGKRHRAARAVDLVGELDAGRGGADDEHAAFLQLARIAVLLRGERGDRGRHRRGERGDGGDVAGAGRQHDGPAAPVATFGDDRIAAVLGADRRHPRPGPDRRGDGAGVARDEVDGLRHRAETVGIVALVAEAGQPALPVGREQAEQVPALRAPRIRDLAALEHHMVDRALGEAAAHGQPGMAGADDDGRSADGSAPARVGRGRLSSPRP